VATYRRPESLDRLLRALDAQAFDGEPPVITVIVVDNDAGESGRGVCERAENWLDHPIRYVLEKRRGIPVVRNAALAVALGFADFVAFTDDDVEPTPRWLAELLRVQARYDADVVTGPCLPRFLEPPPPWIVEGGFHERPRRSTGTAVDRAATGNALVRCATLQVMDRLFDESLGLQGGEDTEFFLRVGQAGHRMLWADEAMVYESVPPSRTTVRWVLQRTYGSASSRANPELRELEGRTCAGAVFEGLRCLVKGGGCLVASIGRGHVERVRALRLLVAGAGWLCGAAGLRYREYRTVHGR